MIRNRRSPNLQFRRGRRCRRPPISAIITTFDRKAHLRECIQSLLWCDEILVVDSFSSDGSRAVAREFEQVRFVQREYFGAASQKNWAMDRACHDWLLILDDDERCTHELRHEIEELLSAGPIHDAYTIHRRCYVLGKPIRFSGWQNDRVVRLLKKGAGRCPDRRVHGDVIPHAKAPRLRQPMLHYLVDDLQEYLNRMSKYGYWGAAQLWKSGRRAGFAEVFGRSAWRFLHTYITRLGVLDGMRGLVFCLAQAYGTYAKWSILWSWGVQARRGIDPVLPVFDEDRQTWEGREEDAKVVRISGRSS